MPEPLARILHEEEAYVFTAEMLSRAAGSLRELDAVGQGHIVFFEEPPSLDDRHREPARALLRDARPEARPSAALDRHPQLAQRIIVPAELKLEVRDELDQANITERVLYPGLDGPSRWLQRYYTPRG